MISESRVPENGMPGLMSGDWKRSTVSGPQRLQRSAWTAPDLSATAPALGYPSFRHHMRYRQVADQPASDQDVDAPTTGECFRGRRIVAGVAFVTLR